MGIHGKSLEFSLSEFESDPSGSVWVTLDVRAVSGDFHGASHCTLPLAQLEATAGELEDLAKGRRARVALVGGWGKREDVRIELSSLGSRGHFAVRVFLTERALQRSAHFDAHFVTEPAPLLRFADALRDALRARLQTTLPMYVDGGPAT